jgi:hypothetical protein
MMPKEPAAPTRPPPPRPRQADRAPRSRRDHDELTKLYDVRWMIPYALEPVRSLPLGRHPPFRLVTIGHVRSP